jgi:hypothetical protein
MKILAPHATALLTPISKILFVLRPWKLEQRNDGPWGANRDFILHYRANPRSADYMLELACKFKDHHAAGATAELLVDEGLTGEISEKEHAWLGRIFANFTFDELIQKKYDTIVLLYPDPIGLGWENSERILKRLKAEQYIVINGRRREFIWDQEARRKLAYRRLIAKADWIEALLAPWLWITASIFYLSDLLTGKTRDKA